jgi:hypothetical protein
MPIAVTCPGCNARLNAPDSAAGKAVKCSQCAAVVPVPAADAGYEVMDAPRPVARAVAARPARDAEVPRPARKPHVIDDDEDDDRPRKRRPRDEDEDEGDDSRPRRGKAKKKGGVPVWVFAAGGGGVLLTIGAVVAVLTFGGKEGGGGLGGGVFGKSPPPGFSDVGDSASGFRVFLPGQVLQARMADAAAREQATANDISMWVGVTRDDDISATSMRPPGNFTPGTSPEQLENMLARYQGVGKGVNTKVVSKTPLTLGGQPALEVRTKYVPSEFPINPNTPEWARKQARENQERQVREAAHTVLYITTDGKRIITLKLMRKGQFIDDATLKIVTDSFEFR